MAERVLDEPLGKVGRTILYVRENWGWITISAATVLVMFGAILHLMDNPLVKMWLIVAAGGWSPEGAAALEKGRLWQASAATLAVLLNTGLLVTIGGFAYSLLKRNRVQLMFISKAIAMRDMAIKQSLFDQVAKGDEALQEAINKAFNEGREEWKADLAILTSEEEAERIIKDMHRISTNEEVG